VVGWLNLLMKIYWHLQVSGDLANRSLEMEPIRMISSSSGSLQTSADLLRAKDRLTDHNLIVDLWIDAVRQPFTHQACNKIVRCQDRHLVACPPACAS
jgi:hypothetical protein